MANPKRPEPQKKAKAIVSKSNNNSKVRVQCC
jgi:hypothetical protein